MPSSNSYPGVAFSFLSSCLLLSFSPSSAFFASSVWRTLDEPADFHSFGYTTDDLSGYFQALSCQHLDEMANSLATAGRLLVARRPETETTVRLCYARVYFAERGSDWNENFDEICVKPLKLVPSWVHESSWVFKKSFNLTILCDELVWRAFHAVHSAVTGNVKERFFFIKAD